MQGKLACAVEVMMNTPYISELLREGNFNEIKAIMEKGDTAGMQTFDQSLYQLYKATRSASRTRSPTPTRAPTSNGRSISAVNPGRIPAIT